MSVGRAVGAIGKAGRRAVGVPPASGGGKATITKELFNTGTIVTPEGCFQVTLEGWTPGGGAGGNQRGGGGGGGYGKKTRATYPGEVISVSIDQGVPWSTAVQLQVNGGFSVDGMVGYGGQHGGDPYGGAGGYVTGAEVAYTGGKGTDAQAGAGGGGGGAAGSNGNGGTGTYVTGGAANGPGSGMGGNGGTSGQNGQNGYDYGGGAGAGGSSNTGAPTSGGRGRVMATFS